MHSIGSHNVTQKLQPRIGKRGGGRWDSHANGKKEAAAIRTLAGFVGARP